MKVFARTLLPNIARIFWGYNLLVLIGASVLTYMLVTTGADWAYFLATRSPALYSVLFPAAIIGGFMPILVPIFLFIVAKDSRARALAWAETQAVIIALFVTSLLKAFTGRIQPNLHDTVTNISGAFQFGFLEHGFFWGWPSSHTATAFAMAVTFARLRPKLKWLVWLVYLYALYIGIGVSTNIHWFSDFVGGALIGIVVGNVVAKSFVHTN